jgi:uncharacterized protein (DUF2236 family)
MHIPSLAIPSPMDIAKAPLELLATPVRAAFAKPMASAFEVERLPEERYDWPQGDPGYFGPDSITWRVHADPSMLVAGLSTLMLQTLHPLAMAGVADHSNFRERPFARLSRTASFVAGTTYGSKEVADKLIAMVSAIHEHITGTAPDGTPYAANDPALLRWVHVAEVWTFLRAYQRYSLKPLSRSQANRYLAETAVVAEKLGATEIPRSIEEVRSYFKRVRPELRFGEQAREGIDFLVTPHATDPALVASHIVLCEAAIDLLPSWARKMLHLRQPRLLEIGAVRPAAWLLVQSFRLALGAPPVVEEARRRALAPSQGPLPSAA